MCCNSYHAQLRWAPVGAETQRRLPEPCCSQCECSTWEQDLRFRPNPALSNCETAATKRLLLMQCMWYRRCSLLGTRPDSGVGVCCLESLGPIVKDPQSVYKTEPSFSIDMCDIEDHAFKSSLTGESKNMIGFLCLGCHCQKQTLPY